MALSWISVDANTGAIIADLPTVRADGSLKRTIGRHETQTVSLPLDGAPLNWQTATRKKSVFIVALSEPLDNEPRGLPVWGGMVIDKTTSHGPDVKLSLVTAEDCLNDHYVGDETLTATPQNTIASYLVGKYVTGIPLRVVSLDGANPARDRTYLDKDDKTVFAILDELSGVSGGPEWTIGWEWVDEQKLGMVLYVGARIGMAAPAGLGPASWFELPGNVTSAELVESYRRGEGANDVMATSSGSGDARPQSSHHVATGDGRPKVEFRWSPSTSITDIGTLEDHAARALASMQNGAVALSITANRDEVTPFSLGDDVGFSLFSPAWPDGISGSARAIGIEWTDTTITPVLNVNGIEGID